MNLELIDAALAAYEGALDEEDGRRLAFFRELWEVAAATAGQARWEHSPADDELRAACQAGVPLFERWPATVDGDALAHAAELLCAQVARSGLFPAPVGERLASLRWAQALSVVGIQDAGRAPARWTARVMGSLDEAWGHGEAAQVAALLASMALNAQLRPAARRAHEALAACGPVKPRPLACPVCGGPPALSHVGAPTASQGRGRVLVCAHCATPWEFERVRCARCGTRNQASLHFASIQGDDAHRLACCDECGGTMRTLYSHKLPGPVSYDVEDVVMTRLSALAD